MKNLTTVPGYSTVRIGEAWMRVISMVLLCASVVALTIPAYAAKTPVFNGSVNVPAAGNITVSTIPQPTSANLIVGWGDSITHGNGASQCNSGRATPPWVTSTPAQMSGDTCWLSLLGLHDNASVYNAGYSGSCLQAPTGGVGCNGDPASADGFSRYNNGSDLISQCGASSFVYIMYSTNDSGAAATYSNFSYSNFQSNLETVVNACVAAGTPKNQITLLAPPQEIRPQYVSYSDGYNAAIAQAAIDTGVNYVDVGAAFAKAGAFGTSYYSADNVHPNDAGHALIASTIEAATSARALSSAASYDAKSQLSDAITAPRLITFPFEAIPSTSFVSMSSDGAATPGLRIVMPFGSTNGTTFWYNNAGSLTQVAQIGVDGTGLFYNLGFRTAGGAISFGGGIGNAFPSISADGAATLGFNVVFPFGSTNGLRVFTNNSGTLSQVAQIDGSGNITGLTLQAKSNGSTPSYVAPTYTTSGTAVGSTLHTVFYSCAFSSASSCAVSLSGAAQFTSGTSYACGGIDTGTTSPTTNYTVGSKSASGFTVYAGVSLTVTVYGTCTGT